MIKRILILSLLYFLLYPPLPSFAQQSTVSLTAEDIIKIAVENMDKNDLLKTELISFERVSIEYDLSRDGKEQSQKRSVTYHGKLYPLIPDNPNDIQPRIHYRNRDEGGFSVNLSGILKLSYRYVFIDPDSTYYSDLPEMYKFSCKDCYVVWFGPKNIMPSVDQIAPPSAGSIDKGIHETAMRMTGIIYVDKDHLFMRKYVGMLTDGFSKAGSSVRITRASINLEQDIREDLNNIVIIKHAEISYQIRIFWLRFMTNKREWQWQNYRLNSEHTSPPPQ